MSIDTSLLARALASDFPYRPGERRLLRHPSRRGTGISERQWQFSLPGSDPDDLRYALEGLRWTAKKHFKDMKVRHLEVYANLDDMVIGYVAVVGGKNDVE
jgi:hypothetical protein